MAKTHSFEFSGKGLAGISAALGGSGLMLFVAGLIVGLSIRPPAPAHATVVAPEVGPTVASAASPDAPPAFDVDATHWPFASAAAAEDSQPAPDSTALPSVAPDSTPVTPRVRGKPAAIRSGVLNVAYVVPPDAGDAAPADAVAPDTARYAVRVGAFRNEQNATTLAARLTAAGYRPRVTVRESAGRPLHIVRIGPLVGHERAARVAEAIGDAERLVAAVVPANVDR